MRTGANTRDEREQVTGHIGSRQVNAPQIRIERLTGQISPQVLGDGRHEEDADGEPEVAQQGKRRLEHPLHQILRARDGWELVEIGGVDHPWAGDGFALRVPRQASEAEEKRLRIVVYSQVVVHAN